MSNNDDRLKLASQQGLRTQVAATSVGAVALASTVRATQDKQSVKVEVGEIIVDLNINGEKYTLAIEPRVTLLDALRERLQLTGSKKGCDHGQCGACTVIIDGQRVYSCLSLAVMQEGKEITTIEGLTQGDDLHPMQLAFIENDGFQCGYCTPGQICAAVALIDEVKRGCASVVSEDFTETLGGAPQLANLSELEIRERMSGNLCRCSAYNGIVAAIQQVAGQVPPEPAAFLMVQGKEKQA
ncbi:aldehyde dehydrogenase iron-sulfur subunit [Dulcicalothrix desertica PCC 7102]|uniref:Aldehyde dehydrogenase iron-sulfur subunit n=1 Tax=Dulcicalothrix desertica PCC 7102 TaxID=232991 RepID=A0A433VAV9_9CYAN|nr:2Fe-2S iron-sulfur cluster-binding protein [Dulcicalothrix desertica]RUT03198.1 aldehyde dehydrogenase iron-sulfur subunit [Dulcicalothrix desertica PCC 7102]TWH53568.1 xanthine dehydrogenase YagT iron-sulfur-binding subunit [Dulcicalothrix desertica PCC 7102]